MAIIVERAGLQDLQALIDLENEVFVSSDGLLSRRAFRYHLKSTNLVLVARQADDDSTVLAYILVLKRKLSARIYSLAVNPKYQGQGIAKQLIEKALDECITHHLHKIKLEVRISNLRAIKLYKQLGFKERSICPNYYEGSEDACRMEWAMDTGLTKKNRPLL